MDWKRVPGNRRGCTALAGVTRSTAELRTCARRESNPRPCDPEVTALFTTGVKATRSGNRRLLRPQPSCLKAGKCSTAELPAHRTPDGIRTRDHSFIRRSNSDLHHGPWRELAGNWRCCCCPCGQTAFRRAGFEPARCRSTLPRSNRHLHHRLADAGASAIDRFAGERAISVFWDGASVQRTGVPTCEVSEIFTTSVG
jgi:hypothetical protein